MNALNKIGMTPLMYACAEDKVTIPTLVNENLKLFNSMFVVTIEYGVSI